MAPYQSEDPSPTLATYRGKEEKGKIVEDKKEESNQANKKALDLLSKPANPTLLVSVRHLFSCITLHICRNTYSKKTYVIYACNNTLLH